MVKEGKMATGLMSNAIGEHKYKDNIISRPKYSRQ